MQPEIYCLHEYLSVHDYNKKWRVVWGKHAQDIGYCPDCGGFGEIQGNNMQQPLEVGSKLYLRKIRTKLPKILRNKFDDFLEYKRNHNAV